MTVVVRGISSSLSSSSLVLLLLLLLLMLLLLLLLLPLLADVVKWTAFGFAVVEEDVFVEVDVEDVEDVAVDDVDELVS